MNPSRLYVQIGAVSAALAVGLGAFGAHGLKNRIQDPNLLKTWDTAAHYHLIHSLALIAVSQCRVRHHLVRGLFLGGITLFSGSLYALVLSGNKKLGAITPIGGLSLIGGWLALAFLGV